MRRWLIGALMMSLLLTGCGRRGQDGETLALDIRSRWLSMTGCVCKVEVTADYGERVFVCDLDVTWDRESGCDIVVAAPEVAAGMGAHMGPDGTSLTYRGASLETGPLTDEGISPLEAVPTLYRQMTEGYMAAWDLSGGVLSLTFRRYGDLPGEGLEGELTFDEATQTPLTGALYWEGKQVLSVTITDFTMMSGAA